MNTLQIQPDNTIKVNYIIHEQGDLFFLLNCVCRKNKKEYFSNIPIACNSFYKILNNQYPSSLDHFSNSLFNSEFPINQVSPKDIIRKDLFVDFNSIVSPIESLRISA